MSKTFKSASSERKVRIWEANLGVAVCVEDPITNETTSTQIAPYDAPALALAILEAAGHGGSSESSRLMQAFDLIELHVKEQERITAEAKEQAELESEALELLLAFQAIDDPDNRGCEWHQYGTNTNDKWLAVARKAREMRAEK